MDFHEAKRRIEVNPDILDWFVDLYEKHSYTLVLSEGPFINSDDCTNFVPGGICVDFNHHPESLTELAIDIIASQMVKGFHEGLEWITIDGKRLAPPHPEDFNKVQSEIGEYCRKLVTEYVNKYT